jgi:hypothetical protein
MSHLPSEKMDDEGDEMWERGKIVVIQKNLKRK